MLASFIAAALAVQFAAADTSPATTIHCGHFIDVDNGKLLGDTTIVVQGGRVQSVSAGNSGGNGSAIDLSGETCMPGLIDSHTHLTGETSPTQYNDQFRWNTADYAIRSTVYARRTLDAGFTTVRNLGDNEGESISLRNAINAGIVP